jgi:Tfp pilus assembly protein PilW
VKRFERKAILGFTLVELMMSLGAGSIILAAVVVAGVSMQRSFAAVESYSTTEGDQLRVLDYIAMDARRCTAASVSGDALALTLPVYYSSVTNTATANQPTLATGGVLSYGSGSVTVNYQQSGSNFTREVVVKNSSGTTTSDITSTIARNVSSFTVTPLDQGATNGTVTCNIMFFPTFTHMTGSGTWRNGPTAPDSSIGANGDWYVIDTTATDATTIGNVYLKSSGAYSLIQNVKATSTYCNVFLRNASARY